MGIIRRTTMESEDFNLVKCICGSVDLTWVDDQASLWLFTDEVQEQLSRYRIRIRRDGFGCADCGRRVDL